MKKIESHFLGVEAVLLSSSWMAEDHNLRGEIQLINGQLRAFIDQLKTT